MEGSDPTYQEHGPEYRAGGITVGLDHLVRNKYHAPHSKVVFVL